MEEKNEIVYSSELIFNLIFKPDLHNSIFREFNMHFNLRYKKRNLNGWF